MGLFRPRGVSMFHISAPYLFAAGSFLDKLLMLPETDTEIENVTAILINAHQQMVDLHDPKGLYGVSVRSAIPAGEHLAKVINEQTNDLTPGRMVAGKDLIEIRRRYEQYRPALLGGLHSMGTFLVTQKGSHEVMTLLFEGEKLFPVDLKDKVPEAIFDSQQAGKCLAYDVATACGFHAFRVTESVVRRYWSFETNGSAPPKTRSLGVYIAAFNRAGVGDAKVLAALKQMNDLHRNPLIHPDSVLTSEDALNIVGLARSAVASMLAHLPKVQPTTITAS